MAEKTRLGETRGKSLSHFRDRSPGYNRSSNWVGDPRLLKAIFDAAKARATDVVLDLATGTGLVAREFRGKVREVIGLDMSAEMTAQATGHVDRLLLGSAEAIPIEDGSVDVCVCRQGMQFMDLGKAVSEVFRVLRPGGRCVLCHLTAYDDRDKAETFRIQALRNPARINFFLPGDMERALKAGGFSIRDVIRYPSRESVNQWIDHGAIADADKEAIRAEYRASSDAFKRLHHIEVSGGDIFDTMLFLIVAAEKRS